MHLIALVTITLLAYRIQAQSAAPANATDSVTTPDAAQNTTSVGPAPTAPGADVPAQTNTTTITSGTSDGGQGLPATSKAVGGSEGPDLKTLPVSMTCEKGLMPFSEADLAAMANNGTLDEKAMANYSSIPTQVACKSGNETVIAGGLCAISSCDTKHPICSTCTEMILTGDTTTTGNVTVDSVKCVNNYMFGTENGTVHNVCTDGVKSYSCSGGCEGYQTCKMCLRMNDTALQGS